MSTNIPLASRRSDLDALRASAMLLGIVLHAALSFFPSFWVVSDSRQNPAFGYIVAAIHGFRMPLFFVMSGFFSAMLMDRRGRGAMVKHRFRRVFLPLLLGMVTVVPATNWISGVAMSSAQKAPQRASPGGEPADIWAAADAGDLAAIERHLAAGASVDSREPGTGATPLIHAAAAGQTKVAKLLIDRGADVNAATNDGSTALHPAAFLGHEEIVRALVEAGADVSATNVRNETPLGLARHDEGTTRYFASMLQLKVADDLAAHKKEIVRYLEERGAAAGGSAGIAEILMQLPLFNHLWFLWFLWLLVLGLAAVSAIGARLPAVRLPSWLVLSPARYLWLVPLTMVPQWFMGREGGGLGFGPDTSAGLLPIPQVFGYYAIFFGFGAIYYRHDDPGGRVGRTWWLPLALALFVAFPLGLGLMNESSGRRIAEGLGLGDPGRRALSVFVQAAYAWLMTFGLMGLFRRTYPVESRTMRYLSDSAYWLYVAHLPLVIGAQYLVRDWPLSAVVKFALIVAVVTAFLLVTYQYLVRYTWLGRFLNGPRSRPERVEASVAVA